MKINPNYLNGDHSKWFYLKLSPKNISVFIFLNYLILTYSIPLIFNGTDYLFFTAEDGLFETAGALMYLLASVLFISLYFKSKPGNDFFFFKTKRNIFYFLLGLLFFICFGEEISWGQRIFNIETPELLKAINMQKEINIHNLYLFHESNLDGVRKEGIEILFTSDRLMAIFWFLYCILIPLLQYNFKKINFFFAKLNLPIVPIWIGILFACNYVFCKLLRILTGHLFILEIDEIKEANLGLLFFVLALSFYFDFAKKSPS